MPGSTTGAIAATTRPGPRLVGGSSGNRDSFDCIRPLDCGIRHRFAFVGEPSDQMTATTPSGSKTASPPKWIRIEPRF